MAPETLELEASSTSQADSTYDEWISTSGGAHPSRYVHLSRFDLELSAALRRVATLQHNWDAQGRTRSTR